MAERAPESLSRIPKVDRVLERPALRELPWRYALIKHAVQDVLEQLRARLRADASVDVPDVDALARAAAQRLEAWTTVRPRRVINATGVVLHTNIGRAPLSDAAIEAMAEAARACDLELDLASGTRGSRFAHLRPFCAALLEAPDVHVVNNGAAALLLACTALAPGGGIVISRGQMVEIGDGFRVADMAAAGGARLVEVGSTNRTHADDYAAALDGGATALLWVHLSNFDQSGFVAQVGLDDLAALARARDVPLIADLGSGSLGAGLPAREPTIREYLERGASVVTCSGDKLLGGPQAGLMAGDRDAIQRCRRHPMARALRPDKTTLAALHATLRAHALEGTPALPVHAMVGASLDELRTRAHAILDALGWERARVRETLATIGGGSLPGDTLPSLAIAVPAERPHAAARALRDAEVPVIGRVHDDELLIDLRTVAPGEDARLLAGLRALGH